jgi:hypothetical protein
MRSRSGLKKIIEESNMITMKLSIETPSRFKESNSNRELVINHKLQQKKGSEISASQTLKNQYRYAMKS